MQSVRFVAFFPIWFVTIVAFLFLLILSGSNGSSSSNIHCVLDCKDLLCLPNMSMLIWCHYLKKILFSGNSNNSFHFMTKSCMDLIVKIIINKYIVQVFNRFHVDCFNQVSDEAVTLINVSCF